MPMCLCRENNAFKVVYKVNIGISSCSAGLIMHDVIGNISVLYLEVHWEL